MSEEEKKMLEEVWRDYKSRSLIEEAEIIHRIQRAPSRRVFYIDVGNLPLHKAKKELQRIKDEFNKEQ